MKFVRIILAIVSGFMALWFATTFFRHILNIGNIVGVSICTFVFLRCLFHKTFKKIKKGFLKRGLTRFIWRFCQIGIALFSVYAIVCTSTMLYFSSITPKENSTVITLGALVHKDHTPSASLKGRIDATYNYLVKHPKAKAVLSGGQGENESISEAQGMFEQLTKMGIQEDRLILEDKSRNTQENIKNSYEIIKENNLPDNIAIATDPYHQLRARIIAKKQGIDTEIGAVNANTTPYIVPTYFVREWFALPVELLK